MNFVTVRRALLICAVVAALLTACCPLYFAGSLIWLYISHGQSLLRALYIASGALWLVVVYVVAALAYAFAPRLRPALALIVGVAAVFAIIQAPTYWSLVQERNLFRNMLAEPMWEMFGRCAIALLAITHLAVERRGARQDGKLEP